MYSDFNILQIFLLQFPAVYTDILISPNTQNLTVTIETIYSAAVYGGVLQAQCLSCLVHVTVSKCSEERFKYSTQLLAWDLGSLKLFAYFKSP